MNQEKKRELSQLLSDAIQYIHIVKHRRDIIDIDVNNYRKLLHRDWIKHEFPPLNKYFKPCISEETISVALLDFIGEELSEHINIDGHIGICPDWINREFHHLLTQLLRIAICFGIAYAVDEFNRCLTENSESIQSCTVLKGISVCNEIQIYDGIRLVELPSARRGRADELSKEILCKMPETLIEAQSNPLNHDNFILGGSLAIIDLTYSPIFLKPQHRSEPIDPLHMSSTSISIKENGLNVNSVSSFLDVLCLSLSLTLNNNVVSTALSWSFHDPRKFSNMSGVGSSGHGGENRYSRWTKTFSTDQLDEFEFIFNKLNSNIPENINRAIRRWLRSKAQRDPVDEMIDLRIALEALYLEDGNKGEAKFRFSSRAAWHLETDNVEQRKKLYKFFRTFYDQSSSSVHSENIKDKEIRKTGYNREEFITKSQDLCRKAILKFLKSENIPAKDKWSDYWSNLTLGGETFK